MGAQWKTKVKSENAAVRGKVFSKLVKEIMVAARNGPDPHSNSHLRMAIDAAKKASMPRDTLERAIKKGAGLLDEQVNFDSITYEGFGPHRVPVIVECLTDNKNRTATSVRMLFRRHQLGNSGTVTWDFNHVGLIEATPPAGADAETAAIESGAQDVEPGDEGGFRFLTETTDLDAVSKTLAAAGWHVASASFAWRPKNPMKLDEAQRADVEAFLHEVDLDDDVQTIFVGMEH